MNWDNGSVGICHFADISKGLFVSMSRCVKVNYLFRFPKLVDKLNKSFIMRWIIWIFITTPFQSWVEDLKADNRHSDKMYVRVGEKSGKKYKMVGYATDYETDTQLVLLKETDGECCTIAN